MRIGIFLLLFYLTVVVSNSKTSSANVVDLSQDFEEVYNSGATILYKIVEKQEQVLSAMVLERGKVVMDYTKEGHDKRKPVHLWSFTKAWTGLLIGIMADSGLISLEDTLGDVWPPEDEVWKDVPKAAERQNITIKSLLTMSSGLVKDPEPFGIIFSLLWQGGNPGGKNVEAALSYLDFESNNVNEFDYLETNNVLSYVIKKKTGMTPRQYSAKEIFPALGIDDTEIEWMQNTDQVESSLHGIKLTAKHMAKFGQLYLQKGLAAPGKQLVSSKWVDLSVSPLVDVNTWAGEDVKALGWKYGFFWWYYEDICVYCAAGLGGQKVCIQPNTERITVQQEDIIAFDGFTPGINFGSISLDTYAFNQDLSFKDICVEHPEWCEEKTEDLCTPCEAAAPCFDDFGCSFRNATTLEWSGDYAACNDGAGYCDGCFPNATCYDACSPCQDAAPCYSAHGCLFRSASRKEWFGPYADCNDGAELCEACFPDACRGDPCDVCKEAEPCFDEIGCSFRNETSFEWLPGDYEPCNDGAINCEFCFPESTCSDHCNACQEAATCFDETGCSFRDETTQLWSGDYMTCNNAGGLCDECFPDSTCSDPCFECEAAAPCFDETGCKFRNETTLEWWGDYDTCNRGGGLCAACFPNSTCVLPSDPTSVETKPSSRLLIEIPKKKTMAHKPKTRSFLVKPASRIVVSKPTSRFLNTEETSAEALDLKDDFGKLDDAPGAELIHKILENEEHVLRAIVIENGKVVVNYTQEGHDPLELVHLWSFTKAWTSFVFGVMSQSGLISLNETLADIWPPSENEDVWSNVPNVTWRQNIKIREMLTMSSGLDSADEGAFLSDYFDKEGGDAGGRNVASALSYNPLIRTDDHDFSYLLTDNILAYVIKERTGLTPREYTAKMILPALGIKESEIDWMQNEDGVESTFHGLKLTAEAMAKFGQLYFQKGLSAPGNELITPEWAAETVSPVVQVKDYFGANVTEANWSFGFMWWIFEEHYCAQGFGGQYVCIEPEMGRIIIKQESMIDQDYFLGLLPFLKLTEFKLESYVFNEDLKFSSTRNAPVCSVVTPSQIAKPTSTESSGGETAEKAVKEVVDAEEVAKETPAPTTPASTGTEEVPESNACKLVIANTFALFIVQLTIAVSVVSTARDMFP